MAHSSKFVLSLISMRICRAESKGEELMFFWKNARNSVERRTQLQKEMEEEQIYLEIEKAKAEWERAVRQFEEAQGKDEIDYAIFVLEAAERKYQIHLKRAKRAGMKKSPVMDRGMSV